MGNLTTHFDSSEFTCKCGCGKVIVNRKLVDMLEQLHKLMNAKAIYINSGYRCEKHDKYVGGSGTGTHTLGYAADIRVQKKTGLYYNSYTVAEYAEIIGFGGIGVGLGDDVSCHVDIRQIGGYANKHWYGNEQTGANYKTFAGMGEKINTETNTKHKIKLYLDDTLIFESEV